MIIFTAARSASSAVIATVAAAAVTPFTTATATSMMSATSTVYLCVAAMSVLGIPLNIVVDFAYGTHDHHNFVDGPGDGASNRWQSSFREVKCRRECKLFVITLSFVSERWPPNLHVGDGNGKKGCDFVLRDTFGRKQPSEVHIFCMDPGGVSIFKFWYHQMKERR